MSELVDRIKEKSEYLGGGMIKADAIINHQLDPVLTREMGKQFAVQLEQAGVHGITRVLTAEVSGIAPALSASMALGVPMVFARKKKPKTLVGNVFSEESISRTKGGAVTLHVSAEYIKPGDRIVIIDDFLATGNTLVALSNIVEQAGATLCAIGCVIEKVFENGRELLKKLNVPVISLARIDIENEIMTVSPPPGASKEK